MHFDEVVNHSKPSLFLIENANKVEDYAEVDLSATNLDAKGISAANPVQLKLYLQAQQAAQNAKVLFGGYLEKRNLYANSALFNSNEIRNIHLGLDFWADAKTGITAPLNGTVQSAYYNEGEGNYGGTIILKHQFKDFSFFSLYGHLSKASLSVKIHSQIKKGDVFCYLGETHENGNYVPHLHFQWILNLPKNAKDYPGVCSATQLEDFVKNSPEPKLVL